MEQKSLYWVSLIIQEDEETKPWLCSKYTGFLTMEEARAEANRRGLKDYKVVKKML